MSIEVIALLSLVVAILVAFFFNINTGLTGISMAFIVGVYIAGMKGKDVIAGFPVNIYLTLLGMMFLFGIAKMNGTLALYASFVSKLAGKRKSLIPIYIYILSGITAAMGPGPVVMTAIIVPIAMEIGKKEKIDDLFMALSVIFGALTGGLTSISVSGYIAYSKGLEVGVTNYTPVFLSCVVTFFIEFVITYIVFKGYKLKSDSDSAEEITLNFDKNQIITSMVIIAVIIGIVFFKANIGLTAFLGGTVLLLLKVADQSKVLSSISWGTLLLVGGMGMLVNVLDKTGAIKLMSDFLSSIMSEQTATAFMAVIAGIMSSVSSASGVVMPTLIPTITDIVNNMGGNVQPVALLAGIVIGAHAVTPSPLSTLGAMSLGAANEYTNKTSMFNKLLMVAILSVIFSGVMGYFGVYAMFGN